MNITPKFVFIHMPKTGGTFVSDSLRKIYNEGSLHYFCLRNETAMHIKNKVYRGLSLPQPHLEFNKHGTCNDIPLRYRHLPILSCIRNPYDWYVSNYKYGWWKTHPQSYPNLKNDPQWPDFNFEHYLTLSNTTWLNIRNPSIQVNPTLGRLTVLFINYYCKNYEDILSSHIDDVHLEKKIKENLRDIVFLDTANLNTELSDYLLSMGYDKNQIRFILSKKKISPRNQRQYNETWDRFYSPQLTEEIRRRDRFLFSLFPQFDLKMRVE